MPGREVQPKRGDPLQVLSFLLYPELWGRNGFDGDEEAGVARRGPTFLVKKVEKNSSANDNVALAA